MFRPRGWKWVANVEKIRGKNTRISGEREGWALRRKGSEHAEVCVFLFFGFVYANPIVVGRKVGGTRETKRPSVETEGRLTIACHMKNLERSM